MTFQQFAENAGADFEIETGEVLFDDEESAEEFRAAAEAAGFVLTMRLNEDQGYYSVREQ